MPGRPGRTPEEKFFSWTTLPFPKVEFEERRAGMVRELRGSGGGVYLTPSRLGLSDGTTFRQLDDFLYFTGLELPDSILAIDSEKGETTVFAPVRDSRFENPSRLNDFPGRLLQGDPELARVSGIGDIRPFDRFEAYLSELVAEDRLLRVSRGEPGPIAPSSLGPVQTWGPLAHFVASLQRTRPQARLQEAYSAIARLRMVKSPAEIAVIRRACLLGAEGLRQAARLVRAGVDERSLEAELEAAYKRGGAQRLGFASIIKSGPNSLWAWRVLASHYDRRNRRMQDGELVIFDVGCELDYYVSDLGRTFPVSGTFTPEQRRILRMEIAVADAMIAAIRPNRTLAEMNEVALASIPPDERPYMQTGLYFGHHIGLSSSDPSLSEVRLQTGSGHHGRALVLQPRSGGRRLHRGRHPGHSRRVGEPDRGPATLAGCPGGPDGGRPPSLRGASRVCSGGPPGPSRRLRTFSRPAVTNWPRMSYNIEAAASEFVRPAG